MDNIQTILQERATAVAQRNVDIMQIQGEEMSVIEFLLVPEKYAIESSYVAEVLPLKELTQIPGVPPFVMGVINLRGKIVSLVNFKILFGLKERGLTNLNKVIILENNNMQFGLVCDDIFGNKTVRSSIFKPLPATIDGAGADYVKGVTGDGLVLLNAEKILSSANLIVNQ